MRIASGSNENFADLDSSNHIPSARPATRTQFLPPCVVCAQMVFKDSLESIFRYEGVILLDVLFSAGLSVGPTREPSLTPLY